MRDILFRGKLKNYEWEYGYYAYGTNIHTGEEICVIAIGKAFFIVDRNTVGQYTGLCDKNGKKIFEGDICKVVYLDKRCNSNGEHYFVENEMIEEVVFEKSAFCFKITIEDIDFYRPISIDIYEKQKIKCFEVIGNIHDNPELLGVEK